MAVIHKEDVEVFELMGNQMRGLATASQGATEVAFWHGITEAGAATPPHSHDHEEIVYCVSGRGSAAVDGTTVTVEPGDLLIVPPDTQHQIFGPDDGEPLVGVAVMPLGTKTFTPDGEEMDLPWAD